ncbi:phosphoribosylanthranilate isomerase [Athalassotoga saccharophila]|uniref:phosphoribosylanthranilate isomerase n=1 Tax=Athalassotoga saccharophila TaxID=1441386 RepID=UPI00137B0806|nr:phosphoribosylanthranilate isomerase [Athalassotoga saccharophila]BBJ28084.1 N-(5'-phosphoribosyl)anthranilate isomerase [Athalassotoga saccharophila]
MVKIKFCGLRRIEDIRYVNILKIDYAGFVFSKSKRIVDKDSARVLIENLDPEIKRVGVFVNEEIDFVAEIVNSLHLDIVQLHGKETDEYVDTLKSLLDVEIWKAVRIKGNENFIFQRADKILLDTFVVGLPGGSGIPFDWNSISNITLNKPFILAGGLNHLNVEKAIEILRPYGVDVSSGIETDGYKDFEKMRLFVEKVRK